MDRSEERSSEAVAAGGPDPPPRPWLGRFVAELHRRRVPRAMVAYVVAAFGAMQGAEVVVSAFDLPRWVLTSAVLLALVGFPINALVAWYVDVTPAGTPAGPPGAAEWGPERRVVLRKPSWVVVGVLAVVVAGLVTAWRLWPRPPAPAAEARAPQPQTVLVADFQNRTGDQVFDGTIEPALVLAMEGASFVNSFSRVAARRTADQLKLEGQGLDERRARLVAQREGIAVVTSGTIDRAGAGYALAVRALDPVSGKVIVEATEPAGGKEAVLAAASKLAAKVRAALGDTVPEAVQLAAAETFSAATLEAAHDYALGMQGQADGRWDDAVRHYRQALAGDPALGRAWAGLATIENNRGRRAEAERDFKQAMSHVDRMSEREKFRTRGAFYLVVDRDAERAVEALGQLVKAYPADNAGLANLAVAYQLRRDFKRALEEGRRAVAISPKNVPQRNNVGLFAMYAGELAAAIQEQEAVLQLNPGFVNGSVGLALAQTAAGRRDDALATWKRLLAGGGAGASMASEGLADLAVAEGRFAEARALLEPAIEADLQGKEPEGAARKLLMLAEIQLATGQPAKALAAAQRARAAADGEYLRFGVARVLLQAGDEKGARAIAEELDNRLAAEPRTYAAVLRGDLEARRRRLPDAIAQYQAAGARLDAWLVHAALGRAYLAAGAFTQAHDELEHCAQRRGEATDLFLDVVPTWRAYAPVLLDLARAHEGLGSPASAEAYRGFLAMRRGDDDPLAAEARKRLAAR